MFFVFMNYWGWLLAALLVGCAVGWLAWSHEPRDGWFKGWLRWWGIAFAIGLLAAWIKLLPGRAGLYLETALWLFAVYIVGCFLGGWLKSLRGGSGDPMLAGASVRALDRQSGGAGRKPESPASAAAKAGAGFTGTQPVGLLARPDDADDLTRIRGIGPGNQTALNGLGVWRYGQIGKWSPENAAWISDKLGAPGRVAREDWAGQAKLLASGGDTSFSSYVKSGAIKPGPEADQPLSEADLAVIRGDLAAGGIGASDAKAKAEAAMSAAAGAAVLAKQEVEAKARTEAEAAAKALVEVEAKAKAEAESVKAAAEAEAKTAMEAAALAKQEAEAKARTDAEAAAETLAEVEAKAKAEAESVKAASDAQAKAAMEAVALAKQEAEAKARTEAEAAAKALAEAAAKAKAETESAKSAAEAQATEAAQAVALASTVDHKPASLAAPNGAADDLKLIKGIGPKNEQICNELGVYHFSQIADWSPQNADWVGRHMKFPGRIDREKWIPQAKLLAAGIDTAHSAGVKSGAIVVDESADAPLSEAEAQAFADNLPKEMAAVEGEDKHEGRRPLGLADARGGSPDDLKRIKGIGKQNEARLHALGVWHFDQISAWSDENVKWVGSYLSFPGRIKREDWINQAKQLATGGDTEFSKRVAAGKVASSKDDGTLGQGNIAKLDEH